MFYNIYWEPEIGRQPSVPAQSRPMDLKLCRVTQAFTHQALTELLLCASLGTGDTEQPASELTGRLVEATERTTNEIVTYLPVAGSKVEKRVNA